MIRFFLSQGKEGEFWDFKQEWHTEMSDLIKDIICFANTVHDENCYLIFGVSNDLVLTGMKKARMKQADIIDAISNLEFAGDVYPKIEVETIKYEGFELDVLIVFNIDRTPIYLKKPYGKMRAGCIYLRTGDKNTPDNGNAHIFDIENLWKKRLGLTKPHLEYICDSMINKLEWNEHERTFYNIFRPEYTLEIIDYEHDNNPEFYAYSMSNKSTSYEMLNIKYQNTILKSYQIVILDSGRLSIPVPKWGFVCYDKYGITPKYSYKYYILGSRRYRVLTFMYNDQNEEQNYAFRRLKEVVLIFNSNEERLAFESYIEDNKTLLEKNIEENKQYEHINAGTELETKVCIERLRAGVSLNKLLNEWRTQND